VRIETNQRALIKDEARRITRQRCRVRIETLCLEAQPGMPAASPGSDAGCGLKRLFAPARDLQSSHHPAAMPGAD